MSKLTRAQRAKLPPSAFGDPAHRLFPILDQDDVDSAAHLIGNAQNKAAVKKRILAIAASKKLTPPAAWTAKKGAAMSAITARFDDYPGDEGESKKEKMSFDEIRQAIRAKLNPNSTSGYGCLPGQPYYWIERVYWDAVIFSNEATNEYYRSTYEIDDEGEATLGEPTEVTLDTKYVPVHMSAVPFSDHTAAPATFSALPATETADGMWIKRGKIFEAGEFPDKAFAMTPEELATAAASFTPVPCDLEHASTILDGQLGQLRSVTLGEDSHDLYGEVALPIWMQPVLGDGPIKVSCTWDRATKTLAGLALVNNPRVPDAAILSAFSAYRHPAPHPPEGAARSGAEATVHAKEQHMTDVMAPATAKKPSFMERLAAFVEGETQPQAISIGGVEYIRKDAEAASVTAPAPAPAPAAVAETPAATTPAATAPAAMSAGESDEMKALRAQLADYQAKDAATAAQAITDAAASFADAQIAANRAFPAERDSIIAVYLRAQSDDVKYPERVTFTEGEAQKEGTRVDELTAQFTARPAHQLTSEMVPEGQDGERLAALANTQVTPTDAEGKPLSEKERQALLSLTPLGQTVLTRATT